MSEGETSSETVTTSTLGIVFLGSRCLSRILDRYVAFSPPPNPVFGSAVRTVTNGSTLRATNVPCPGLDSSRPSSVSRLMASLTVFREAWYCSLSSPSVDSLTLGRAVRLDLGAQIVCDVPVHRLVLRHLSSIGTNNPNDTVHRGHRDIRCCLVYTRMSMV